MSEPARILQSLNLDDMPVTRSGLQTSQDPPRGAMSPRTRGRARGRVQTPVPPVDPTKAYSGVEYDTDIFSPTFAQRARKGLQSEMVVDQVQSHGSGSDRYYAFQISKPVIVHIHDPAGSSDRIIECTCDKYKDTETPCKHIWVRCCRGWTVAQNLLTNTVVIRWSTQDPDSWPRDSCTKTHSACFNDSIPPNVPTYPRRNVGHTATRAQSGGR